MFLLIYDISDAFQYTRASLDFIRLTQYIAHDNKSLHYMTYALYRLEVTKIAFDHHWPIDSKIN